jgi:hypothetical protein
VDFWDDYSDWVLCCGRRRGRGLIRAKPGVCISTILYWCWEWAIILQAFVNIKFPLCPTAVHIQDGTGGRVRVTPRQFRWPLSQSD